MKGFPGRELSLDPAAAGSSGLYARLLGAPANGLRIRLRRVLPATDGDYRDDPRRRLRPGRVLARAGQAPPRGRRCSAWSCEPGRWSRGPTRSPSRAGLTNLPLRAGRRDPARLRRRVRPRRQRRQPRARRGRRQRHAGAAARAAARAAASSSTSPATSGAGSSFGRRVNFDVPGHVRPGYRADELVTKLRGGRLRGRRPASPRTACIETFTNNISYVDQRRRPAPQGPLRAGLPGAARRLLARQVARKPRVGCRACWPSRAARPTARAQERSDRCAS